MRACGCVSTLSPEINLAEEASSSADNLETTHSPVLPSSPRSPPLSAALRHSPHLRRCLTTSCATESTKTSIISGVTIPSSVSHSLPSPGLFFHHSIAHLLNCSSGILLIFSLSLIRRPGTGADQTNMNDCMRSYCYWSCNHPRTHGNSCGCVRQMCVPCHSALSKLMNNFGHWQGNEQTYYYRRPWSLPDLQPHSDHPNHATRRHANMTHNPSSERAS